MTGLQALPDRPILHCSRRSRTKERTDSLKENNDGNGEEGREEEEEEEEDIAKVIHECFFYIDVIT